MTYLAPIEAHELRADRPTGDDRVASPQAWDFSPLEWSVIRLARATGCGPSGVSGGSVASGTGWLGRANPKLANEKLEALRRMAVLTWHFGFTVPGRRCR